MYVNTSAVVLTPEGKTTNFNINIGVLQGDPLAPFLFIIVLVYALRTVIDDREGLTLTRCRSSISLTWIKPMTSLCSLTRYKKQNFYFIKWKVLPNLLDYFSTQAKQSTCISTHQLMIVFTHQMGVKLRK